MSASTLCVQSVYQLTAGAVQFGMAALLLDAPVDSPRVSGVAYTLIFTGILTVCLGLNGVCSLRGRVVAVVPGVVAAVIPGTPLSQAIEDQSQN
ncbi:MAG: hypothetical protein KBC64_02815 [Simkaniaceae bacterium]|nr:hypothetical protein [Simkaniaceae bacterium]